MVGPSGGQARIVELLADVTVRLQHHGMWAGDARAKERRGRLRKLKKGDQKELEGVVNPINTFRTLIIFVPIESPERELSIGTKISYAR